MTDLATALREVRSAALWKLARRKRWATSRAEIAGLVGVRTDAEVAALLAGRTVTLPEPRAVTTGARPWWRFWGRR